MKVATCQVVVAGIACVLWGLPALAAGGGAATQGPELPVRMTDSETKAVDAVVAAAKGAGFPDAKGATVYAGKISVLATFDPAKPAPLPSAASTMQESIPNSKDMTYGYTFEGLHFKLADGSWIISTAYRFKPGDGDKVDVADAKAVNLDTLLEDAAKEVPIDAEKDAGKYLDTFVPQERARAKETITRMAPVVQYLHMGREDTIPAVVLLQEAGWKHSGELSLVIASTRASSYWQLYPWTVTGTTFDPTGEYAELNAQEAAWRKTHPPLTSEAPAVALRRGLFRWCRGQMNQAGEPELLPLEVATAVSKVMVEPGDPQHFAALVDVQAAGMRLPVTPPEKADLAARLASWELRGRQPQMVVSSGGGAGGVVSMSTSFSMPVAAYVPEKGDLDALVAPWVGQNGLTADIPLPRLIDASMSPTNTSCAPSGR